MLADHRRGAGVEQRRGRADSATTAPGPPRTGRGSSRRARGSGRSASGRRGGRRSRPAPASAASTATSCGRTALTRSASGSGSGVRASKLATCARRVDAGVGAPGDRQRDPLAADPLDRGLELAPGRCAGPGCAAQPAKRCRRTRSSAGRWHHPDGDRARLDQLEEDHLGRVRPARAELDDPRVAARALRVARARSPRTACGPGTCPGRARESAWRRACRSPRLPSVISFSSCGLTAFAFACEVWIRSWSITSRQRLRSSARRWARVAGELVALLAVAHDRDSRKLEPTRRAARARARGGPPSPLRSSACRSSGSR